MLALAAINVVSSAYLMVVRPTLYFDRRSVIRRRPSKFRTALREASCRPAAMPHGRVQEPTLDCRPVTPALDIQKMMCSPSECPRAELLGPSSNLRAFALRRLHG
jgi:hypothetical protein